MKKISIVIPTFYEQDNVIPLTQAIIKQMEQLPQYDYEILFIDNDSKDKTRIHIRQLCKDNSRIKAIFNSKNFGGINSPVHGLYHSSGDCTILICADFQDPVEMIPRFVEEWENGYKIVCGIKTTSKENKLMYFIRSCYYKMIKSMSDVEQIEHFTGFGLYDASFLDQMRELKDPIPFLRGIVAELGFKRKEIPYHQERRRTGKTSTNFFRLYDLAMLSFTTYTKIGLRLATFVGFLFSALSMLIALVYLVLKLLYWSSFTMGMAPLLIGVFLFGSVQLFFIGLLGEYIMSINIRLMNRPLAVEEERINFEDRETSQK